MALRCRGTLEGLEDMMHLCSLSCSCHFFPQLSCQSFLCMSCHLLMVPFVRGGSLLRVYVVSARAVFFYKEGHNWSDPPLQNHSGRQRAVAFILTLLLKVSLVPEKTTCLLFLLQFYSELAMCSSVCSLSKTSSCLKGER